MADALCGPSSALQTFSKHASTDRTLQQDRLASRQGPVESFRSQRPNPHAPLLDAEFAAFQASRSSLPLEAGDAGLLVPGHHGNHVHHQHVHLPAPNQQLPAWAQDFRNLGLNGPIPSTQFRYEAPLQLRGRNELASGMSRWKDEFKPHGADSSALSSSSASSQLYPQQYPTHSGLYGGSSYQAGMGTMLLAPYSEQSESSWRHLQQAQQPQQDDLFDETAFAKAFDDARDQMESEMSTSDQVRGKERADDTTLETRRDGGLETDVPEPELDTSMPRFDMSHADTSAPDLSTFQMGTEEHLRSLWRERDGYVTEAVRQDPRPWEIQLAVGRQALLRDERILDEGVVRQDDHKWKCQVDDCHKLFVGEDYWKKHAENRHKDWIAEIHNAFKVAVNEDAVKDLGRNYLVYPEARQHPKTQQTSVANLALANAATNVPREELSEEYPAQQGSGDQLLPMRQEIIPPIEEQRASEAEAEAVEAQLEADELSRTAGQLLESMKDEQGDKFANSTFLALMRQLRDREVRIEGDKMVETSQALHPGGSNYPHDAFGEPLSLPPDGQSVAVSDMLKGEDVLRFSRLPRIHELPPQMDPEGGYLPRVNVNGIEEN